MLFVSRKSFQIFASCVWVCLAAFTTVYGQYQIETWTTDNGLPQNTVYSILQTPDGYLWMTTLDGLVRFDGVRFTVFDRQGGNSATAIMSLAIGGAAAVLGLLFGMREAHQAS